MDKRKKDVFISHTDFTVGKTNLHDYRNRPMNPQGDVIIFCNSGYAVFSLNFRNYILKEGELLILIFNTFPVFLRSSADFTMSYCMLAADYSYEVSYPVSPEFLEYIFQNPVFVIPQDKVQPLILWWELLFHYSADKNNLQQRLIVRNHVQNLLLNVDEGTKAYIQLYQINASTRQQIIYAEFCKLIWANCTRHHDVKFYADKLCITPYYLSCITHEIAGESAKKIIDYYLTIEIKMLLETSDITIKELAEKLHFEDPSYLCRYFKRQTGVALTDYRKR